MYRDVMYGSSILYRRFLYKSETGRRPMATPVPHGATRQVYRLSVVRMDAPYGIVRHCTIRYGTILYDLIYLQI
jgi:hypothetical protein